MRANPLHYPVIYSLFPFILSSLVHLRQINFSASHLVLCSWWLFSDKSRGFASTGETAHQWGSCISESRAGSQIWNQLYRKFRHTRYSSIGSGDAAWFHQVDNYSLRNVKLFWGILTSCSQVPSNLIQRSEFYYLIWLDIIFAGHRSYLFHILFSVENGKHFCEK